MGYTLFISIFLGDDVASFSFGIALSGVFWAVNGRKEIKAPLKAPLRKRKVERERECRSLLGERG